MHPLKQIVSDLTQSERFVLEWLGREDWSSKGECKGAALDRLFELGLIKEGPHNPKGDDFRAVGLNHDGFVALNYIRLGAV